MHYIPRNYEQINIAAGTRSPSSMKSYNNRAFWYWERSLFQRACSAIELNVPEEWEGNVKNFLYWCLFQRGFVAVSEDAAHGKFFQPCTLSGFNFYYQPVSVLISNPDLQTELTIGKDCELLQLTPDYFGVWDIIEYYAEKLSLLDNAINISLVNNKFAFWIAARNKQAGQAIKKMLDLVNRGEPAVVYDQKLLNDPTDKAEPWQFLERKDLKSSYLTTDQLRDFQTILNNFDAEIGIPTIPYEKKERMVTSEAESRQIDSITRATVWLDCLESSIKLVNDHYNLGLAARLRFDPGEGANNEQRENNPAGVFPMDER